VPDYRLPDLGEGVTEGEVDKWLVKEGDVIEEDDLLVEIITDKATAEIPSPFTGVVNKIHVGEGEVVPVGTVLISIGDPETAATAPATPASRTPANTGTNRAPDRAGTAPRRVRAMPPVRKLARDLGIDIAEVSGSGPHGRILRSDVEAHTALDGAAEEPSSHGVPAAMASEEGRREPLRGIRRTIAERMATAHRLVPSVTHVEECDVTELDATRRLANERDPQGPKLTYLPFIIKAVVAGLRDNPELNSSLDEESNEIVFYDRFHIGVAVDTPRGLMVPVVRDADRQSPRQLAAELERLAEGARNGTLRADELLGSTFTVTSPGPYGGVMATPIILHPQAAILGVHRAADRAVVRDGGVVVRKMMNLSVTFDHRILDGMTAARFMLDVVRLLEHPAVLVLE
jgi:pyruvate/2-oxoglutarate dehydrogenase complex dihydrolipoamide acyltransferase (E2) component